ncbi:hypothetical protein CEE37_09375 [candidate division LCP-89 bacterium B3_LCP]|uniref:MobA-like NTP transferase domain-containing protein n=1 Tax=candidate division LCP-89 bacterium B3_LCP TaxID=2012998 RepID=A0A532UYV8_UNCL8|nr:MAG: hypothetical protein CEE37_09375 [candidate division LCP-89 bacterium B3_LCP]
MQAIILAAGAGRRLGGRVPKPLIEINGEQLLIRSINQLNDHNVVDIIVVTGYQKHLVEGAVTSLNVRTVFNPFYPMSDNLASFWAGRMYLDDTCIMAHGDLILEDELLERLIHAEGDIVLPMDRSSVDEEAMKMKVDDGMLMGLSKSIPVHQATGESIPLMKFSAGVLEDLKIVIEEALNKGNFKQLLDEAVFKVVQRAKFVTTILDVTGLKWIEIDTKDDLKRAVDIFGENA